MGSEDSLTERRLYQGPCTNEAELAEIFEYFIRLKSVFRSIIRKQGSYAGTDRRGIIDYIDSFYKLIKDHEIVRREFIDICIE